MGREPRAVQVEPKPNGVAHNTVYVAPRVAERNIEAKDYEVKECTEENLILEKFHEKQEVLSIKSTNLDVEEPRVEKFGEYKKSSPIGSKSPGNMRGQYTVPQPFMLETEKRRPCTHSIGNDVTTTTTGVNISPNLQSPNAKKNSQVTNIHNCFAISIFELCIMSYVFVLPFTLLVQRIEERKKCLFSFFLFDSE